MSKKAAAKWVKINELKPWKDNPRINDEAIEKVATSIKRFGFAAPIIANQDFTIIAGHTRLEAAKSLNLKEVPVRFLDLDPVDAQLLALADNKLGEISQWDNLKLQDIFKKVDFSMDDLLIAGFNQESIDDIIDFDIPSFDDPISNDYQDEEITNEDKIPIEVEPITKNGDQIDIGNHKVICGDCVEVMKTFESDSIDFILTDPPYGLSFLNQAWDQNVPQDDWSKECFRILKPGGYLIAFSATRTYHRLGMVIESAGFEIRDTINWMYFTGFPKSANISILIDNAAGEEREIIGQKNSSLGGTVAAGLRDVEYINQHKNKTFNITKPKTELAKRFDGYGTALKPSFEPAMLARKPLSEKNIAANVSKWGTGGLNIDDCRFAFGDPCWVGSQEDFNNDPMLPKEKGRWPANTYQCKKVSMSEREKGCEDLPSKTGAELVNRQEGSAGMNNPRAGAGRTASEVKNIHPTVKPIKLMRWLCRLGMPPYKDAVLLDTFSGSGSTLVAAEKEGFKSIGIEMNPKYVDIIRARLTHACQNEE